MALRNILQYDDEALHKACREVTDVNDRIRTLIDDLTDTLRDAKGVGLAAPQVGVLRRVAVVELDENHHYEMVNPRIVEEEGEQYGEEGCLSVDGMCGDVKRPLHVKVACLDRNGNPVEYEGTELLARAFCHEIDHLDGIIYTQKADNIRPIEYGAPEDSEK